MKIKNPNIRNKNYFEEVITVINKILNSSLSCYLKIIFDGNNTVFIESNHKYYYIHDNGGEFNIAKLNTEEIVSIPYGNDIDSIEVGLIMSEYFKTKKINYSFRVGNGIFIERVKQLQILRKYYLE